MRAFADGDFDDLTRLVELQFAEQVFIADTGLAGAGVPTAVLGKLEILWIVNSYLSRIEDADYFEGLTNLRELAITTNNMIYELPGNSHRPEGTGSGRGINPEAWRPLANLRRLKIGSNRILTLPRIGDRLTRILAQNQRFELGCGNRRIRDATDP